MKPLDQERISKILGSTMKPVKRGGKKVAVKGEPTAEHTPLPWALSGTMISSAPRSKNIKTNIGVIFRRICTTDNPVYMTEAEALANARFIWTACMCHDVMLDALKEIASGKYGSHSMGVARKAIEAVERMGA